MKHKHFSLLLAVLMSMVASVASAYDFEVDGIYYKFTNSIVKDAVAVTWGTGYVSDHYKGSVIIPASVKYDGTTYPVTAIGDYAFSSCSELESISLPNTISIYDVGKQAFYGCSALTSVTLNCKNVEYLVEKFGNQVEEYVFGEDVERVDYEIVDDSLKRLIVKSYRTILSGSTYSEFEGHTIDIYAYCGSYAVLYAWQNKQRAINIENNQELFPPCIEVIGTTQTTVTIKVSNTYEEYYYDVEASQQIYDDSYEGYTTDAFAHSPVTDGTFTLYGLLPSEPGMFSRLALYVNPIDELDRKENVYWGIYDFEDTNNPFTTKPLNQSLTVIEKSPTSFTLVGSIDPGDVSIINKGIEVLDKDCETNYHPRFWNSQGSDTLVVTGLSPHTSYYAQYLVSVRHSFTTPWEGFRDYLLTTYVTTDAPTFTTLQPKVIAPGDVVVAAESNFDDDDAVVGFEWRRTDWTDEFASNVGEAHLFDGVMEGYIHGLNVNFLWKFRPYYKADDGNYYYGEWVGIDPTNTSYFEPTVHTYSQTSVEGNSVEVKGYVMRGTDNIASQGIMYWIESNEEETAPVGMKRIARVPADAVKVESSGQVMKVSLTNLLAATTYHYVAYVKTSEGDTFYGEEQSFTTGGDQTGIENLSATEGAEKTEGTEIYDLSGRRLARMQKGINIVRTADGKTRKVLK